ncbi:membrane protein [Staphylococcus argenteus]|uniref:PH domain-containing protein n=1 Tax=Staphylococcus argenteus TaxID=985002 RepID=UPI000912FDAC|nr:PH domain-containing protein [Staphylococcus argenteus]SGX74057.1 membrane protein [Staphylococcus argenteus]
MSNQLIKSKSPKQALLYYYITNGLDFLLSVIIYAIFYLVWLKFEWSQYLLYILFVFCTFTVLKLIIKPLWQYHCRYYQVDQSSIQYRTSFLIYKEKTSRIERLQYLSIKSNSLSQMLNLYKVEFVTAGHSIRLPMMSDSDVKIIEEQTLSNLKGVESDV